MKVTSKHLYADDRVTIDRVDAFAVASRREQVLVLTELRRRSGEDPNDVQTSVMVGAFGVLSTLFVAPKVADLVQTLGSEPWLLWLPTGVAAGVVIIISLSPVIVSALLRGSKRERAALWLRAFEDELERRRSMGGRSGRLWRRLH